MEKTCFRLVLWIRIHEFLDPDPDPQPCSPRVTMDIYDRVVIVPCITWLLRCTLPYNSAYTSATLKKVPAQHGHVYLVTLYRPPFPEYFVHVTKEMVNIKQDLINNSEKGNTEKICEKRSSAQDTDNFQNLFIFKIIQNEMFAMKNG